MFLVAVDSQDTSHRVTIYNIYNIHIHIQKIIIKIALEKSLPRDVQKEGHWLENGRDFQLHGVSGEVLERGGTSG